MLSQIEIEDSFAALSLVRLHEARKGVPRDITDKLDALCCSFAEAPDSTKRSIMERITPKMSFLFIGHAHDMAVRAVREKNEKLIFTGLIALAVENGTFDWRDSTIRMALLYRSAQLIGTNPYEIFRRAAAAALPKANEYLLAFVARKEENKSLAKFFYKESATATGEFTYVPFSR